MNTLSTASSKPSSARWRYSPPAIVLHWGLAILLSALAGLGWYMMSIEDNPGSDWYFNLHKSLGLLFAGLLVLRLLWRLTNRPEPHPDTLPVWQNRLASGTQVLLYVLMVLMPLTGLLGASFSEEGVSFFGRALPQWFTPNHDRAEQFFELHEAIIWALVALVSLHVLGALKHLFIDKDGVFQRMWFRA